MLQPPPQPDDLPHRGPPYQDLPQRGLPYQDLPHRGLPYHDLPTLSPARHDHPSYDLPHQGAVPLGPDEPELFVDAMHRIARYLDTWSDRS